eukprot:416323-Heterocapsa_arctica.AAC.1
MPVSIPQQTSGFMPRLHTPVSYRFHAGFIRFHAGCMPRTIPGFIPVVSCRFHGVHQEAAVSYT